MHLLSFWLFLFVWNEVNGSVIVILSVQKIKIKFIDTVIHHIYSLNNVCIANFELVHLYTHTRINVIKDKCILLPDLVDPTLNMIPYTTYIANVSNDRLYPLSEPVLSIFSCGYQH